MLNGYIERAMDAYSRAYNIAKADPKLKTYSDGIYSQIQSLYKVRFPKNEGMDAWIGSTIAKPFPDPATAVTPVNDDTTTNTSGGATTPASTTAPIKPAATSPAKPAAAKTTTATTKGTKK
jgi:hypothetical protein